MKQREKYNMEVAKALTSKLNRQILKKNLREEKRKDKTGKLCRVLIMSIAVIASTGCSLADTSSIGYSAGGNAWEMAVPRAGWIEHTERITVHPDDSTPTGRMYNTSSYDKITDYLFGRVK